MADGWTCGGAQAGDVYLHVLFAFIFADESDGFCWFRSELPSSKWPDLVHPSIIFHGLPFSCPCFLPGTKKYMFAELMIKSSKIMRNSTDFHRTWIWWWWFDHVWPRLVRGPWVIQEYFQVGSKGGAGGWSSKLVEVAQGGAPQQ